jgi:hypothetical protein
MAETMPFPSCYPPPPLSLPATYIASTPPIPPPPFFSRDSKQTRTAAPSQRPSPPLPALDGRQSLSRALCLTHSLPLTLPPSLSVWAVAGREHSNAQASRLRLNRRYAPRLNPKPYSTPFSTPEPRLPKPQNQWPKPGTLTRSPIPETWDPKPAASGWVLSS